MYEFRGERTPFATVSDIVRAAAERFGDALALDVVGARATYREIDDWSDRVAGHLHALGVGKGDIVCTFMPNRLEQVLVWFGANKIGAVWSPINAALVGEDLRYTLEDAGARVLIVDGELCPVIAALPADLLASLSLWATGDMPAAGFGSFTRFLEPHSGLPAVEIERSDPAAIVYTGGTTGRPKGVVIPHFQYVVCAHRYRWNLSLREGDRYYSVMQLYHIGGQCGAVMCSFAWGVTGFIDHKFSVSNFLRRAIETGATVIDPVGTMVLFLCNRPEGPEDRAHSIRISMDSTGQIAGDVAQRFSKRYGIQLCATYAQSECGGGYLITCPPGENYRPGALGKPWGWAEAAIFDDDDNPQPPGVVGEIVLRPTIPFSFMLGYHGQPEKTIETFRNCWLHTGDLGRMDEDGYFWFEGRRAHWLRRRGENISAIEVERILADYPGVREICVVGVPSEHGEEEVKAFIVSDAGAAIDPQALCDWAAERMARFKIPRFIEFVEDFPRSATKREIERHTLRAMWNERSWDRERQS